MTTFEERPPTQTDAAILDDWQNELDNELRCTVLAPSGWTPGTRRRAVSDLLADLWALAALQGRAYRQAKERE